MRLPTIEFVQQLMLNEKKKIYLFILADDLTMKRNNNIEIAHTHPNPHKAQD